MEILLLTTIILVAIIAYLMYEIHARGVRLDKLRLELSRLSDKRQIEREAGKAGEESVSFSLVKRINELLNAVYAEQRKADVAVGFRVFLDASQMITASDRASDAWNAYIKTQERIEEYAKKKEGKE